MLNFDKKYFFIVIIVISEYVDMNPSEFFFWKEIFQFVK